MKHDSIYKVDAIYRPYIYNEGVNQSVWERKPGPTELRDAATACQINVATSLIRRLQRARAEPNTASVIVSLSGFVTVVVYIIL